VRQRQQAQQQHIQAVYRSLDKVHSINIKLYQLVPIPTSSSTSTWSQKIA
jgi:hypothetical protein